MPANTADKFILVIDDDAMLRQALQDILEISGYKVMTAGSAHEGLQVLEAAGRLPDVIVSDFRLPGLNGEQFLERVQQNLAWRHIPFIFVSGSREDLSGSWVSFEPNVVACLAKPFTIQKLIAVIVQAISAAHAS
jgi:CheY-like chemotaxis protein